jgi:PilZ domain-containing protein
MPLPVTDRWQPGSFAAARGHNGGSIATPFPQEGPHRGISMRTERRRETRFPFIAMAEIVDERENARTSSRISDLSLHGCYAEMMNPFPQGTNVLIEIYTETESLETQATVAFFEAKQGMGLQFREMPEYYTNVLNRWLTDAKGKKAN